MNTLQNKTQSVFFWGGADKVTCMHLSIGVFDLYLSFEFKTYVKRNAVRLAFGLNTDQDLSFKVLPFRYKDNFVSEICSYGQGHFPFFMKASIFMH